MKLSQWLWVIAGALTAIILVFVLILTRVIIKPHPSWWWFLAFLILAIIAWIIAGMIALINYLSKDKVPKTKLDPEDAIKKAVKKIKYDEENPDNFMITNRTIRNVGQEGKPRTPILWLSGKGTELNQKLDVLINLNKVKLEMGKLVNATDKEVQEAIRLMAENPESEVVEERTQMADEFGRAITKTITRKVSQEEKQKEEEKKQADIAQTF